MPIPSLPISRPKTQYWVSFFLLLILFTLCFFSGSGTDIDGHFFNSDTLYLPSLYKDLLIDGNNIATWKLNPAPNFFPDMPVYFILNRITGSILWSSFLYSILQILTIEIVLLNIFKKVFKKPYQLLIMANALLCLFPLCELINDNFLFVFYFLSNSYHLGSFVLTLLILNLTLSQLQYPKVSNLIFIGLISFASTMSDFLFIISATVPLILTSILLFKQKKIEIIKLSLTSVLSTALGFIFLKFLQHNHFIQLDEANSFLETENIFNSFKEFGFQTYFILTKLDISSLIIALSFFSLVLLSRKSYFVVFKKTSATDLEKGLLLFITLSIYALFAAPIFAGNYTGPDTIRYNYHAYILLIALLPYVTQSIWMVDNKIKFDLKYILAIKSLIVFFFVVHLSFNGKNYFTFYPEKAEIADQFSLETGLKTGAGGYWDAKLITMFSQNDVVILSTFESLLPYEHVANSSWFYKHPLDALKRMEIEFNIIDGNPRKSIIISSFENVITKESYWSSMGETYLIHPKYYYNKQMQFIPVGQ